VKKWLEKSKKEIKKIWKSKSKKEIKKIWKSKGTLKKEFFFWQKNV